MGNEKDFASGIRVSAFEGSETVKKAAVGFVEKVEGGGGEESEEAETRWGERWGHVWNYISGFRGFRNYKEQQGGPS